MSTKQIVNKDQGGRSAAQRSRCGPGPLSLDNGLNLRGKHGRARQAEQGVFCVDAEGGELPTNGSMRMPP